MTSKENKQGLFDLPAPAPGLLRFRHQTLRLPPRVLAGQMVRNLSVVRRRGPYRGHRRGIPQYLAGRAHIAPPRGTGRCMQKATEITARSIGWRRGCGGAACRTPRSGKSCAGRSASLPCPCFSARCSGPFTRRGRGSSGLASSAVLRMEFFFALIKFVPKVISAGWSKTAFLPFSSART